MGAHHAFRFGDVDPQGSLQNDRVQMQCRVEALSEMWNIGQIPSEGRKQASQQQDQDGHGQCKGKGAICK